LREAHGELPQSNFDVEHRSDRICSSGLRRRQQSSESASDFSDVESGASNIDHGWNDGVAYGYRQQ
jgi:hypothetical protein